LEAIQVCATLHDVCIGKTGTLTLSQMDVRKLSVANRPDIAEFKNHTQDEAKSFYTDNQISQGISTIINRCIIGGTQAWLSVNNDIMNLNNIKDMKSGYRQNEGADGSDSGPFHEPQGTDIEKSLLQFLLDMGSDVHENLTFRNRWEDVTCYIPFNNRIKIKVTCRGLSDVMQQNQYG